MANCSATFRAQPTCCTAVIAGNDPFWQKKKKVEKDSLFSQAK